jgi:mannosyl-3-phosphoglycerate phosphatase
MRKPVVFTDLDETLLERANYSFDKASIALSLLREKNIPLVICSSKTRAEIERYRKGLRNSHPFISENGGGIFVPDGYFKDMRGQEASAENGYLAITMGTVYARLREALKGLREEGFDVKGFGDMSTAEVSEVTGLSEEEAALARQRQYDEAFVFRGDTAALRMAAGKRGLRLAEGRLLHLTGDNDKGKAVEILKSLYTANYGETVFIALGDSPADIPMLEKADYPVLVKKENGNYDARVKVPNLIRAGGIGPEGWNSAVVELIGKLS